MYSRETPRLGPLRFLICCGCMFAVTAGCAKSGPKLVQVEGKISSGGKPVPRGKLTLYPDAKKGNKSMERPLGNIENGTYHVVTGLQDGAPPGWYNVAVNAAEQIDPKDPYFTHWLVPEKYSHPETAKLQIEVVENPAPGAYDLKLDALAK